MLNLVNHVNPVYGPRANRRRTVDRINGINMISARTHHRLLNVARTIADLAGEERVVRPGCQRWRESPLGL